MNTSCQLFKDSFIDWPRNVNSQQISSIWILEGLTALLLSRVETNPNEPLFKRSKKPSRQKSDCLFHYKHTKTQQQSWWTWFNFLSVLTGTLGNTYIMRIFTPSQTKCASGDTTKFGQVNTNTLLLPGTSLMLARSTITAVFSVTTKCHVMTPILLFYSLVSQ